MVDVSAKPIVARMARARGRIVLARETLALIASDRIAKGNVLATARVAGIMAGKSCSGLIPLCHPLCVDRLDVSLELEDDGIAIEAVAAIASKTGVEMEALTAVSAAALTIWDMCKAVDHAMRIEGIVLLEKTKGEAPS
jgi:cyclic pyranopterin phosphate synthase